MAGSESIRLTNADFQKFVTTTSISNTRSAKTTNAKAKQSNSSGTRIIRKEKAAVKDSTKPDDELSLVNIMQKYRDRAKERRVVTNGGSAQVDAFVTDAAARLTSAAVADANKFPSVSDVGDQKRRGVEESKYLGGDIEHTHLVRGLDYALLQKVRADLEQQMQGEKHVDDESREKTSATGNECETDGSPAFLSRLARDIYDMHFNFEYPERHELFTPGRMCFEYDLQDPEFTGTPTVLVRSKAEIKLDDAKTVSTTALVIDKLTEIFAYMRKGLRVTKLPKRQRVEDPLLSQSAAAMPRPIDPRDAAYKDADIFDDDEHTDQRDLDKERAGSVFRADDYRKRVDDRENGRRTGSYFRRATADSNGDGTRKRPAVDSDDDSDERKARLIEMHSELARLRESDDLSTLLGKTTRRRDRGSKGRDIADQTEDTYAECYPSYDISATTNDSDDEHTPEGQQLLKETDGSKKSQLSRWDFDSQEDYFKYKGQLVVTPRAAFQFGQKVNDGRKSRKAAAAAKSGASTDKVKYDQQWTKIQKIINAKKDSK